MKTILLAAATLTLLALPASAAPWVCTTEGLNNKICVTEDIAADEDMKKLAPALKEAGYPSKIVVTSPEDYKIVNSGWKSRGVCGQVSPRFRDNRVNIAKVVYCDLRKKGYRIRKPQIVKNY